MSTVGENEITTINKNSRKRRMSIIHYKKEKSIVVILVMVTFMFTVSTIPNGIGLIFKYLAPEVNENPTFQNFKVITNLLELVNASLNFYMYCLCNKDIRHQAAKIVCSTFSFWKSESGSSASIQETSTYRKYDSWNKVYEMRWRLLESLTDNKC